MKNIHISSVRIRRKMIMGVFMFLIMGSVTVFGAVQGTITKIGGDKISGEIRWQGSTKEYVVVTDRFTVQVALKDVAEIKVNEPPKLRDAVNRVKTQPQSAIADLEEIVNSYSMLQWDLVAGRWLAEAYMKTKQAPKAVAVCDKVMMDAKPTDITGDMSKIYWDALFECKLYDKLRADLTKRVEAGDRETVAIAQVKRADIDMANGNYEKALIDGYLRTVTLFKTEKSIRPEAIYKAMKCFEALGQQSHAAKMKKILLAEFPEHPYSKEMK